VCYHHFCEHVRKGLIKIFPVDTKDQIANALTKPLAQNDFQRHCRFMCSKSPSQATKVRECYVLSTLVLSFRCMSRSIVISSFSSAWLAMSANVSVGCTRQTTDIFVCRRHVGNVVPTCRRHSVMSAIFLAVGVVSVRPIVDTHTYMYVGISIDEVVTTYEDKKNYPLRFYIHSQVLTLSRSK
jgi:hypothetical protein